MSCQLLLEEAEVGLLEVVAYSWAYPSANLWLDQSDLLVGVSQNSVENI